MHDAVAVIQAREWHHRPLIAVNLWLYRWTERWVPNHLKNWWEAFPHAEPGTIFAWDARFCLDPDHDFTFAEIANDPRWRLAWTSPPDGEARTPFLAFFERRSPPAATQPTTLPAPATDPAPTDRQHPRASGPALSLPLAGEPTGS